MRARRPSLLLATLGMIVLIGCGALLGGGAILDEIQTAIAVSP